MEFDSLIFDVDGTLWDVTESVAKGYSAGSSASPYGMKTFTREQIRAELGRPLKVIFEDLYPEIAAIREDKMRPEAERLEADATIDHIMEYSTARQFEAILEDEQHMYEGAEETLDVLSGRLPLYIVSNCELGYIELMLKKTGTESFFKGHLCFGDTGREKDYTIRKLMEDNNLRRSCYVGDILNDALSSRKAGVEFIWASYGFGEVPRELYYRKINEFRELENIIVRCADGRCARG